MGILGFAMAVKAQGDEWWSELFLSAALEPHRWNDAMRTIAAATGSRHGQLIGFGPGTASFNWISDIDESIVEKGMAIDHVTPDLNFRVAADRLPGRPAVVHEAHYDLARQGLRADDYLDLCADFDIFDGCQTRILAGGDSMIGFALLRSGRDGRTTDEQRALFGSVAGHVRTAVRLQKAIEEQGFSLLSGTFEQMDRACWLLDATGRVGGMTPRAQSLLSDGRLRLDGNRLASRNPDESRAMMQAARIALDPPARASAPVALADADGGVAMLLEYYPLPVRPWALPFAPRAVVVARLNASTDHHRQLLIDSFRLTRAEADIAVRLSIGQSRQEIASARGVSAETLKAQIRSIYDKTGCSRESQLVRLVTLLSH